MRPIKFRGQRADDGKWVYGGVEQNSITIIYDDTLPYDNENLVYKETVGQFTGLYDKNGKEIYEGDLVVYYASGFARIEFVAGGFHIIQEEYGFDFMGQMLATIEVIGNIFDNKELL